MSADPIYLSMQARGVVTIPIEVRRRLNADQPGSQLRLVETGDGTYELTAVAAVPAEQAWFWTDRWQQMEREADHAFADGDSKIFPDVDSLLRDLDD